MEKIMAEPSIAPAPGLIRDADSRSGQPTQFALFTDDWLQLQAYVGAALDLPITSGDFEGKYGSLGSSQVIKDCITAMGGVRDSATEFGNPKTLRAALIANPNLLATRDPPAEIYTHTVWLGQRVHETAAKLQSGYQSVLDQLVGLPSKDQVDALKQYLFDVTLGPIPLAKKMSDEAGALIKKLGAFEQKMNQYNEKLQAFTSGSSAMIAEVNSAIGSAEQKIKDLERSRDEAYVAWRNFTIAAVTTSVGCALIGGLLAPFTFGVSALVGGVAAIATAIGLGIKAAQCRAEYNAYCNLIATQTVELQKKQRLRSDLGDFNTQMQRVGPAMGSFLKSLQTVQGVWVQMNTDMVSLANEITPDNVGNVPFLVKAKANLAIASWQGVDASAKQFTVASLVDYTSIAFGDKMPDRPMALAA
jgi:hypothetical protein